MTIRGTGVLPRRVARRQDQRPRSQQAAPRGQRVGHGRCGDGDGEILAGAGPGAIFALHHDGGTAASIAKVDFPAFTLPLYGVNVAAELGYR